MHRAATTANSRGAPGAMAIPAAPKRGFWPRAVAFMCHRFEPIWAHHGHSTHALGARLQLVHAARWMQWRDERRRALLRDQLLKQDLDWERRLAFAGRAT